MRTNERRIEPAKTVCVWNALGPDIDLPGGIAGIPEKRDPEGTLLLAWIECAFRHSILLHIHMRLYEELGQPVN
jgi:hypothetical protein